MKCKKCGAEVLKTHNNCPECGYKLKSKKPLILSLFSIILSVLIVLSSGTIAFSVFNEELMKTNSATVTQEGETADNIPQADLTKPPEIRVQIDDENCFVGQESTVYFRAYTPEKAESVRLVRTDNNAEITNLTVTEQLPDGIWQISGEYTFTPDKAGKINFRAYAGEKFSEETYINVYTLYSDEDFAEFEQVSAELDSFLDTVDFEDVSIDEELDTVKQWLESDSDISEIYIEDSTLYYTTNCGIEGFYTAVGSNVDITSTDSATDDFKENTTAVEYYNEWTSGTSLIDRENHISYLPADISITNDKTIVMVPTMHSTDGFDDIFFKEMLREIDGSDKLDSIPFLCDTAQATIDAIRNRDLIEYGSVYLCAHGGNDGNYYFTAFDTTDKDTYKSFKNKYKELLRSSGNDWEIIFGTKKKDGVKHYYAWISSRFIMNQYRGYTFDNTMFVFFSCKGLSDNTFNSFLLNNKAQLLIGSMQDVFFITWEALFDSFFYNMYYEKDNEDGDFIHSWLNAVENGSVEINYKNTAVSVDDYLKRQKKNVKRKDRESKSDLDAVAVNGRIIDIVRLERYFNWIFGEDLVEIDITPYREETELADGTTRSAGAFDMTFVISDGLVFLTNDNSNFSLGGNGSITGTLYNGTVTRTYSPGGGYTDVNNKGEILKDTEIAAYRFLNQSFKEELTVTSGKDGKFTFKAEDDGVFPWGHYVIASKDEDYDGEASIILVEHATNGGDLILHGGKSTLSGIVQGEKSATDKSLVILKDAKINLVDSRGDTVASTSAGSDGSFTFKDIEKGTYTLVFTCKDYEKLTMSVNIENGFVYQYSLGCIILEPIESIMDVVLVLDTSGSMSGDPIAATRSAASQFANTVLGADKSCRIGVVTYDSGAYTACGFTKYASTCNPIINDIGTGGGTDIESGLSAASSLLSQSEARNKIIVLMSDGEPNEGKTGDSLVSYANDIKSDGIIIYTIGFFSGISNEQTRNECRSLMGRLASRGYHFEGNSLSELSSFFNDMALMASDKSVTHIEVACPVDVKVSYNGETLSSAEDSLCTRTSFGTLMFDGNENDPTKIIRLSEDVDFTVEIIGTGKGTMDYTISYVDENGNYTDTRSIKKVPITKEFTAVTTTAKTETTTMKVDADGDGKVDLVYENSGKKETNITDAKQFAEKVMKITAIVVASILGVIVIIILIVKIVPVIKEKKKQKAERKANMPEVRKPVSYTGKKSKSAPVTVMTPAYKFCFNCGEKLENGVTFCGNCGNEQPDMKDKEDKKSSESFVDKKAAVNAKPIKHKTKIQNTPIAFCPECGGKIPEGATFCGNCGKSLK